MAPGRVNLIGEYTDFNAGFVLPMAVDRGVYVAIRPRTDQRVCVASVRYHERIEYELDQVPKVVPGHWSCYVLGVVEELRKLNLVASGFEAVIDGDLNLGAGLSSSAALETATALALKAVFGFEMNRIDVATLCQRVEHHYAHVMARDLPELENSFDLVVVDVPCSGSGRWRRNPETKWQMDPKALEDLCALQAKILK